MEEIVDTVTPDHDETLPADRPVNQPRKRGENAPIYEVPKTGPVGEEGSSHGSPSQSRPQLVFGRTDRAVRRHDAPRSKGPRIREDSKDGPAPKRCEASQLSRTDLQIISLVIRGLYDEEIATTLSISKEAVKSRLAAILERVGVSDRLSLVVYAVQNKVVAATKIPHTADRRESPAD